MQADLATLAAVLSQAVAAHRAGQTEQAAAGYRQVLAGAPDCFDALHLMGVLEHQCGRPVAALPWFDRAIAVDARQAAAHANHAAALRDLQRPADALQACDRALALHPGQVDAWVNRAASLLDLQRPQPALEACDEALRLQPDHAAASFNRANALRLLGRGHDALAAFDRVRVLLPSHGPLWVHHGNLLLEQGRPAEAVTSLQKALTLLPGDVAAQLNLAHALAACNRLEEALAGYRRVHAAAPSAPWLLGDLLHTRMQLCDWGGLEADVQALVRGIEAGAPVAAPFAVAALPLPSSLRRRCAERFVRELYPHTGAALAARPADGGRIRLAYFSSDFRRHAVAFLSAGLFEQHDRSRFELVGFSFGPPTDHPLRQRIEAAFERFHDVGAMSDDEVVALARRMQIDIAVDLNGHTRGSRPAVLARRVAPLQVSYLGFPGTMGAPCMDYLIADSTVLPPGDEQHYSEKVVRLPHSYQVNDDLRPIAPTRPSRQAMGLPDDGFVFCGFNRLAKITPDLFEIWMRLLRRVDRSVLWLLIDQPAALRNLRVEAGRQGVAGERLVPAGLVDQLPEHLARQGAADLYLDTFHYNGHTMVSDALWAGLPVLSCPGEAFPGRVGASLLKAVGLPDMIAPDPAAYESMALALATEPGRLADVRQRLQAQRLGCPLFDTALTTRHLEDAYQAIWQRHRLGLAPAHIDLLPGHRLPQQ